MKIANILVATDFSDGANAAVAAALTWAEALGATVHVFHVVEYGPAANAWASEFYITEMADLQTALVQNAEERLRSDVARLDRPKVQITSDVQLGRAASTIVDAATHRGCGLIVTGTRGQTGLPHLLLGSVAERVVRTAPCPVLTVHAPRPGGVGRIVVATDFDPASDAALESAAALAKAFTAPLHLVHVVEDPFPMGGDIYVRTALEIREYLLKRARTELARRLASITDVATTSEAVAGIPAQTIVDTAARLDADLIVMGTHGRNAVAHVLLGSVADRVMRTALCPVLTVRAR